MNDLATGELWTRLRERLTHAGRSPAVTFLDARLTPTSYSGDELLTRVDEIAARLRALRLVDGAPLGILCTSQEVQVTHFLAALSIDTPPAVLTPANRKMQLGHYLAMIEHVTKQCGFAAIVSDLAMPQVHARTLEPWTMREVQTAADFPAARVESASFLQFSSGTTGMKRGVLVSDAAVLAQVDTYADALQLATADTIVGWLPLYHDMGLIAGMMLPLVRGVHTVMLQPLDWVADPSLYLRAVTKYRGTLSWHPNFAFAFMADRVPIEKNAAIDVASLRGLVNCSEPVTATSQDRFLARFATCGLRPDVFFGCYAMAETTFALTHGRSSDPRYRDEAGGAVSVGRPLPGVQIEIVDRSGSPVPERSSGEIRVRSPFTFNGYHNNPEATDAAFSDGWYCTGDVGYRVGDELFVNGRQKDLIIVGGVNVWPQDLEAIAYEVRGIHSGRAVAFAEFDPAFQTERVILLAETAAAPDAHRALVVEIRQRILAELQIANFEVHLIEPGWLAKSSSGKISRGLNRERWRARLSGL